MNSSMKNLLIAVFALVSVLAKAMPPDSTGSDTSLPIQALLRGKWLNGSFSMSNWWTYDGKQYIGNPYTRSVAFNISEKGQSEFFLIIKTHTGYCTTEAFTYQRGTIKFTEGEQSFTFIPESGNYRGYYSCAKSSNFNRDAKPEELKPTKYYWSMEKDNQAQDMLVIRVSNDPSAVGSYFKKTDW